MLHKVLLFIRRHYQSDEYCVETGQPGAVAQIFFYGSVKTLWSPSPPPVPCGSHNLMNFSWALPLPLPAKEFAAVVSVFFISIRPTARNWDCRKPLFIAHPNTTIRFSSTRKQQIRLGQDSAVEKSRHRAFQPGFYFRPDEFASPNISCKGLCAARSVTTIIFRSAGRCT